ncbi:T9SS type A sorting domain-containing protein [Algoriphagus marinus]|uniref:T9SS type A sorting domain-containing protein n=1 Tax=Algoriphagus marinus TaxID=1925762 RepID=UPI00094BA2C0|nr:T9SS type A sorting domain-containing protein [Algoriphagus marinus]
MKTRVKTLSHLFIFRCRIYSILSAVIGICLFRISATAQEINAYKTVSSGIYSNPAIWHIFDGTSWVPALAKPSNTNDIYIDQTHLVTLTGNEQAKSVFINSETSAGQKLNLNSRELEIYGSLNAFSGPAPGLPSGTWNSQNWIGNSIGSRLIFKGNSRTIIRKNHWSGFTINSRYSVIFDPGIGQELVIEEPFKAVQFTVRSGTVIQKLDSTIIPALCASLSFNNETTVYGAGPFGTLTVESGATFLSQCNLGILFRSATVSAGLFDLQSGGRLILEGQNPRMEAATFQLDGSVIFRGGSAPKTFLSSSYTDASIPNQVTDLELQGNQNLSIPSPFFVQGNITQSGLGAILASPTDLHFIGNLTQTIEGFALTTRNLTVNKTGGRVNLNQNLTITQTLSMIDGILNFNENSLFVNSSSIGGINYASGSWERLGEIHYFSLPATLNETNATFPFADRYQKGTRSVQLLGNTSGEDLRISFTEYDGAEYNSGFDDNDGTPILYRLFSYFNFYGLTSNSNPVELRISADNLIVDQVDDLRIVGTGYAAPGNHLPGLDPTLLWARRDLTFSQLEGVNFTVGSFRTLSVLPVTWLTVEAKRSFSKVELSWKLASEEGNKEFEIYRSTNPQKEWKMLGKIASKGDSNEPVVYSFDDFDSYPNQIAYYRIKQIDFSGNYSWSNVIASSPINFEESHFQIFPNPYRNGRIRIIVNSELFSENTQMEVFDIQGQLLKSLNWSESECSNFLESLNPGIYLIRLKSIHGQKSIRWVRQ